MQVVFQDPHASLNPAMTIEESVGHPLRIHKIAKGVELRRRVAEVLATVGLSPPEQYMDKYPSDLSGGQKQRAVIARAIVLNPSLLVADEPVSMLDMSVRAKILELMLYLKRELDLTYLYITHDLATAKFFCDRIAILYLGRIVEIGPSEVIYEDPKHPYTKALLRAIPEPDPRRSVPRDLPRGEVPDAARPPRGCSFHPRCPRVRGVRLGAARPGGLARGALGAPAGGAVRGGAGDRRRPLGARDGGYQGATAVEREGQVARRSRASSRLSEPTIRTTRSGAAFGRSSWRTATSISRCSSRWRRDSSASAPRRWSVTCSTTTRSRRPRSGSSNARPPRRTSCKTATHL